MIRALAATLLVVLLSPSAGRAQQLVEHVVQPGESLWEIAARLSGNPRLWPALYRANRDQIKDPSRLYPGQSLRIPDLRLEGDAHPPGASEAPVRY